MASRQGQAAQPLPLGLAGPPGRNPLPPPPGLPRLLQELGLILLLAFAPSLLGLLFLALGLAATGEIEAEVAPSLIGNAGRPVHLLVAGAGVPLPAAPQPRGLGRSASPGSGLRDLLMGLVLWVASFVLRGMLAQLFQYFGQREVDFLPENLFLVVPGRCRRC